MAFGRVRLYHWNNRAGKVFDNEADYLAHLNLGWVDFPTKIVIPDMTPPARDEMSENMTDHLSATVFPEPKPFVTEAAPEPIPEKPKVVPSVKASKPGRPFKKSKGGK